MVADVHDREHRGKPLHSYAAACAMLAAEAEPLARESERVPLREALGRILAEPLRLDRDEPPVARSAMDGFALASADGGGPRRLAGAVHAGDAGGAALARGEAIAVMTGGSLPAGADCVVPVEQAHMEAGILRLDAAPQPGRHVRPAGEIGRAGRTVLAAGARLGAGELMVAASCGADPVQVRARPRVAVLSTGDEVVAWTRAPLPHQVRDANRLGVIARLTALGARIVGDDHAPDEAGALRGALAAALARADLVVTIGGVSMGTRDLLPAVFRELGVAERLHGVALQPGKPVWIGRTPAAWVVGLPGNPLSSFVVNELFARPLLARLAGERGAAWPEPLLPARTATPLRSRAREAWLPAAVAPDADGELLARAAPWTGSGDWSALAGANALLRLPPDAALAAGDPVRYLPLA